MAAELGHIAGQWLLSMGLVFILVGVWWLLNRSLRADNAQALEQGDLEGAGKEDEDRETIVTDMACHGCSVSESCAITPRNGPELKPYRSPNDVNGGTEVRTGTVRSATR